MSLTTWLGRRVRRRAAAGKAAAAPGRTVQRPALSLREREEDQASLGARLDLLSRHLDAMPGLTPDQRADLCRAEHEIRVRLAAAARQLTGFRRRCWWVILVQVCLLAAMLAAFAFLPELQGA